jgi:hypothetical protein
MTLLLDQGTTLLRQSNQTGPGYKPLKLLCLCLFSLALIACQYQVVGNDAVDTITEKAITYLHHEYNPALGLIRESPETAPDKHWLMTDNWLAATALDRVHDTEFAAHIQATLQTYGYLQHGLIEAITGTDIAWPPRTHVYVKIKPNIWLETRNQQIMEDWSTYADLALYRALDLYNEGRIAESRQQYKAAMQRFDGIGFADQAFDGRYATYKLALAIYVAGTIGVSIDPAIVTALLSKQHQVSGGFSALYDETGNPIGDSNTETTSYALLALSIPQE